MSTPFDAPIGDFDDSQFSLPPLPVPEQEAQDSAPALPAFLVPPIMQARAMEKINFTGRVLIHMVDGDDVILARLGEIMAETYQHARENGASEEDIAKAPGLEELREDLHMAHQILHALGIDTRS